MSSISDFNPDEFEPRRLLLVLQVARRLAAPHDLEHLLSEIIDAARQVLDADRGTVFLYDAQQRELFSTVATGGQQIRFSIDRGIAGECARERRIINVPDCYADARFNPEIDRKTGYRTRCLITVPLIGLDDELVGVLQLLNAQEGAFDSADEHLAVILASQAAAAIQRARLLDERLVKLQLERDIAVARQIQESFLPSQMPVVPGYEIAARSVPADQTGGDAFDLAVLPARSRDETDKLMMLVADASGHGIGPALSVTQVRAMLRLGVRMHAGLDELHAHINWQLAEDLQAQRFVTAFLGVLDPALHQVSYHAAGQGPLLLVKENEDVWRRASCIPLGILPEAPVAIQQQLQMDAGDVLVLLTDGIYEYRNGQHEQMGQPRVAQLVREHRERSAEEILDRLFAQVQQHGTGMPQEDDLTAVIIKRVN